MPKTARQESAWHRYWGFNMRRISFNPRFVCESGRDLIPGKIHTIRKNYEWWKRFEGERIQLFYWGGVPYRRYSKQIVFAEKKIYKVERILKETDGITPGSPFSIYRSPNESYAEQMLLGELAKNDGLTEKEFVDWFAGYKDGYMGIIHFSDFDYRRGKNE